MSAEVPRASARVRVDLHLEEVFPVIAGLAVGIDTVGRAAAPFALIQPSIPGATVFCERQALVLVQYPSLSAKIVGRREGSLTLLHAHGARAFLRRDFGRIFAALGLAHAIAR